MHIQNRGDIMNGPWQGAEKVLVRESWYNGTLARHFRCWLKFLGLVFCAVAIDPVFATTVKHQVRPPAGLVLSSSADDDTGSRKVSPSAISEGTILGSEESDAVSRALKDAIATYPKAPFSAGVAPGSVITQEIRYEFPEAGEVFVLWGINGWHFMPEATRHPGTVAKYGLMYTTMTHRGDTFTTRIEVPPDTVIDYCFHITKTRTNAGLDIWDTGGYPPRCYQAIARPDHPAVVLGTLNLEKAQAEANRTYAPLVTQEIRYHANGARDVTLVWGINGWQTVSENIRPLGTVLKDKRMHTPMAQKGDTFIAKVQVPSRAIIDYGFLITQTHGSLDASIWNGAEDFHRIVTEDAIIDVNAKVGSAMQDAVQSESSENASDNSVVTQGFRNHNVYWLILALLVLGISVLIPLKLRKII